MENFNDEYEKKYLLKRIPYFPNWDKILFIRQYYLDYNLRYRITHEKNGEDFIDVGREMIRKESYGPGHNKEYHIPVDAKAGLDNIRNAKRVISKYRYVLNGEGLKYEVDVFSDCLLVMLEIEHEKEREITIPDFLKKEIIMEVTGIKEFNNFNLAQIIKL